MSDFEHKELTGTLFQNRDKTEDRHPSMKGEVKIDGKVYRVSAWTKQSEKAGKWLSLALEPKDAPPKSSSAGGFVPSFDDDAVPF